MPKYFAAPGSPFSDKDAEIIGPELSKLAESGASSPLDIVAYARANDTPLRRYLHMDRPLEVAADLWYRRRAQKIAGAIMVRVRTDAGFATLRAFHSVVVTISAPDSADVAVRRYVTVQQVQRSEPMAEQVIADALERLGAWRDRYAAYRSVFGEKHPRLLDIFAAIEEVTKVA